jgi:hypothetical protein
VRGSLRLEPIAEGEAPRACRLGAVAHRALRGCILERIGDRQELASFR